MRLSNQFLPASIAVFVALSTPAMVSADFSDDPLDYDVLEPTTVQHSGTDPNVSRFFFMPTFETLPQGRATIGTTELLTVHGAFSPLNFVQIGGTVIPWMPGVVSVGAKVRLWRSANQHVGVAVGGNYTSLFVDLGNEGYGAVTTGYVVGGYSDGRGQAQFGLFVMKTRSRDLVSFAPPPEPDFFNRRVETERDLFGVFGLSARVKENTHAMLEVWGIGIDDSSPVVLPGFRFFEGRTSFEAIFTPVWFDDGRLRYGLPIFNVTHHFR